MTISDVHLNFKLRLDKIDSLQYPDILPEEIDLILNDAQDRIVKQRYGFNNLKHQSFEETQKRTEDLKNIVKNASLVPLPFNNSNINTNARFVTLPTDHWFIVYEACKLRCNLCGSDQNVFAQVEPVRHSEFAKRITDPFQKPDDESVLRLMESGRAELVTTSTCEILEYQIRYIKEPVRVSLSGNVTFELSSHMHSEIIDMAVDIALENIESQRVKTFNPLINNTNE